jgi:hypothetical protein
MMAGLRHVCQARILDIRVSSYLVRSTGRVNILLVGGTDHRVLGVRIAGVKPDEVVSNILRSQYR